MMIANNGVASSRATCLISVKRSHGENEGAVVALVLRKHQPEPGWGVNCGDGTQEGGRG